MSDAAAQMAIEDRIGDLLGAGEPTGEQGPAPAPTPAPTGEQAPPPPAPEDTPPAGGEPVIEGFSAEALASTMGIEHTTKPPVGEQDPPPDDDDKENEPPASVKNDPKANSSWQHLRQTSKSLKKENEALKQQLAAAQGGDQTPEELAKLKATLAEKEEELGKYNLAATSEFKARFETPMNNVVQKGVSLLVRSGKTADEAKALMNKVVAQKDLAGVDEVIYELSGSLHGAITAIYSEFADMSDAKDAALKEWKETQAALGVQAKTAYNAKVNETIAAGVNSALQKVVKNGNWMYMVPDGNEVAKETVAKRVEAVRGLLKTAQAEDIAFWVLEGLTAQPARELAANLNAQMNELKNRTNKVIGAQPEVKGAPASMQKASSTTGPKDIGSVVDEVFSN